MKANAANFLDFLRKSPQFVIPIYQRAYSWTRDECKQLWDDILRAGRSENVSSHFVGSIVYIEKGIYQVTSQSQLLVIDGQQRLTTVSLLIAALAQELERSDGGPREPVEGFSPRKLRNYYLVNPEEEGDLHYKLLLSETDRATLCALVRGDEIPDDCSLRIRDNFAFFKEKISSCKGDLSALCRGLAKLVVVDIALTRGQDDPQLIFESMNSTGRELSQADLIRNFILMGLEPELQTRLYTEQWRPMEKGFGQEAYGAHFDGFMRHYLTMKTGDIPNVREVYEAFKAYARSASRPPTIEALVKELREYAGYYCAMALGNEPDKALRWAFEDLRELKVDVAYPFLLEVYGDYSRGIISRADLSRIVRLVEAYVFRRAVCAIPTNSLNKTFATLAKMLDKQRYVESLEAHLLSLPSYRRFPSDEEFRRDLKTRDLYNFGTRRSYWLRRMENHGRKERVLVNEYTIEHIMPQNQELCPEWRAALGPDWQRIQQTWLHTLGNLTLTGYNSEYRDRPFAEKRDMPGGFKESPLKLNEGLGQVAEWTQEAIAARAERLANLALEVWPAPDLPAEMVKNHRRGSTGNGNGRSIQDHPALLTSPMREVFEAFRREVLALDDCVTEEFLKLYVAYKAETNFVDVVPLSKRLRLFLNMPFSEIQDPRGLCKDVSNVGRWGNGDVEVSLESVGELPYVMTLVRQAFERQMGTDGDL